jgi:hypothetical protein
MSTTKTRRPRKPRRSRGVRTHHRQAARALVEALARHIGLPRGVPSAPGQPGHVAWRRARERLLHMQLDLMAEERRQREARER